MGRILIPQTGQQLITKQNQKKNKEIAPVQMNRLSILSWGIPRKQGAIIAE